MLSNRLLENIFLRRYWTLTVLVLGAFLIVSLQVRMDRIRSAAQKVEELRFIPSGQSLRIASLGYKEFAADLLWLKVIQFVGGKDQTGKGYDWLYHVLDVVTDLDPKFFEAYQFGTMALSILGDNADQSVLLLQKGVTHISDRWELYFYLGFNYYYFLEDFKNAAAYMQRASEFPGHPEYVVGLTARLYAESQSPATGLAFMEKVYQSTDDPMIRERLKKMMDALEVKATLKELDAAAAKFRVRHPSETPTVDRLVALGFLPAWPTEPYGGTYYWDSSRRSFATTSRPEDLKVHINEKGRQRHERD